MEDKCCDIRLRKESNHEMRTHRACSHLPERSRVRDRRRGPGFSSQNGLSERLGSFRKLAGTEKLQKQIEQGLSAEEIRDSWKEGLESFKEIRKKYILYD